MCVRMAITIVVLGVEFMALAVGTIWCAFQNLSYGLCVLEKSIPKHYNLVLFLFVL